MLFLFIWTHIVHAVSGRWLAWLCLWLEKHCCCNWCIMTLRRLLIVENAYSTTKLCLLRNYGIIEWKWDVLISNFGLVTGSTCLFCFSIHHRVIHHLLLQLLVLCLQYKCVSLNDVRICKEIWLSMIEGLIPWCDYWLSDILSRIILGEGARPLLSLCFHFLEFYWAHFHPVLVLHDVPLRVKRRSNCLRLRW